MNTILEIRAAEGGQDSKLLVEDMALIYQKACTIRNTQIGSGERSDKRRTYRDKDDLVIDHLNNKSARLKDIIRGKINLLHKV